MALQMEARRAARLVVPGLQRFHVLDDIGMPMCMVPWRPPLYPIDHDHQLPLALIPHYARCRRWGCSEAWHELTD